MEENVKKEKELEEVDGPRVKQAKEKIVEEGIKIEEELLEKEDKLYEGMVPFLFFYLAHTLQDLRQVARFFYGNFRVYYKCRIKYLPLSDLSEKEDEITDLEEEKEDKLNEAKEHMEKAEKGTPPPESQFKKLAPNENKYTIVQRDEL